MAMMDIPADILASLVCSKCEQLLKRGPVYQQHDGAAVCGLCQAREDAQPASRCLLYEATAQLLRFPCRYQEEGCPTTVPFVAAGSTEFTHEDACEYRQYVCPVLGSNRCDWAGRRNQLLQHCEDKHPDRVLPNPTLITPDIRHSQMTDFVISAFKFLFLLHTRVCVSTAKLHYAVRLLDDPKEASNYTFTVTIQRGEDALTRSRDVLPQELLALQEHSALNFSINGLLGMLGDWDGASLSVEVKARRPQMQPEQEQAPKRKQAKQDQEQCVECEDIGRGNRDKHSWYFCQRRTWCWLCDAVRQPGTQWQQHYITCRGIKVIPVGSKFLVRRNIFIQDFLVETAAGHVVCSCEYTHHNFSLYIRTNLPFGQLYLYRCDVRLECAGNIRTHTPDIIYNNSCDWEVKCEAYKFLPNPNVYVHVQVCKN